MNYSSSMIPLDKAPGRLSPEEFRAIAQGKGWSYVALAKRWEKSPEWISKIARNPSRPSQYDDAIRGLPSLKSSPVRRRHAPAHQRRGSGFRYSGTLGLGDLVNVENTFGSMAEVGQRGLVLRVIEEPTRETYLVLFESGEMEIFDPDLFDQFLGFSGLSDRIAALYVFQDEATVARDFKSHRFNFRPELPQNNV